jgi:hypothetical protein
METREFYLRPENVIQLWKKMIIIQESYWPLIWLKQTFMVCYSILIIYLIPIILSGKTVLTKEFKRFVDLL